MITLSHSPTNSDKFARLIEFLKEVLDICSELDISPVLEGSLAVFAYTQDTEMTVNDVDLACSEKEFSKMISILEGRRIDYKLREWHVLQILKDDLKVELGSMEYWYKDLPINYETLRIDNYSIKMLALNSLKEFYRQGLKDRMHKPEETEKLKYEALKAKYEALERL